MNCSVLSNLVKLKSVLFGDLKYRSMKIDFEKKSIIYCYRDEIEFKISGLI